MSIRFTSPDCSTGSVGSWSTPPIAGYDAGTQWQDMIRVLELPAGALSAHVSFLVDQASATSYQVHLDDLQFSTLEVIFADGFETGDFTQWSNHTP